jgi:nitroreductase
VTGPVDPLAYRPLEHGVDPLFVARWSPRAMSGAPVTAEALTRLFEAARWAPSSYNNQPWRFRYALAGSAHWSAFLGLLAETNRAWCVRAGALLVLLSRTTFDHNGKPARTHSLDAGAALQNLQLQGRRDGLVVHAMQGFDADAARGLLNVPEDLAVEVMAAVGHPAPPDTLPEALRARERPSGRKPLADLAGEGPF